MNILNVRKDEDVNSDYKDGSKRILRGGDV
jgi:hypothetical protein